MRRVFLYSLLLVVGLTGSQFAVGHGRTTINLLTMFCLSHIMIRVGFEFESSKEQPSNVFRDQIVALSTTILPWLFCSLYLVFALAPRELWRSRDMWWEALIAGRFAATTSVGVLFSMLAAAGLSATWLYKKARILAIFDDLDAMLLLVPLRFLVLSRNLILLLVIVVFLTLCWAIWKYIYVGRRAVNLPSSWPWLMVYSAVITLVFEGINFGSGIIAENVPVQLEVLLPAFILGCVLARNISVGATSVAHHEREELVARILSACFMALVGLSMPPFFGSPHQTLTDESLTPKFEGFPPEVMASLNQFPGWGAIALHVLAMTILSNLGKFSPAFCYRREATRRERLALSVGMCPRGEVGAGMLVVSLAYGVSGTVLTVSALALALNLLCSGLFILAVKRLATRTL